MPFLHTIIKNGDHDVLASDSHLPCLLHIHVQHSSSVRIPHQWIARIIEVHWIIEGSVGINGRVRLLFHPPGLLLETSELIELILSTKLLLSESSSKELPGPLLPALHHLLLCFVNMLMIIQTAVSLLMSIHRSSAHVVTLKQIIIISCNKVSW